MASDAAVVVPPRFAARTRVATAVSTERAFARSGGTATSAHTAASRGGVSTGWLAPATGSSRNMQPASPAAGRAASPPSTARRVVRVT
jgi:hypothetical protein